MSTRKYMRLVDGYHERSPYNQSNKYSSKQSNNISESRSERSSNVNGGSRSRNDSPRSRHSNMSPRSQRASSSYSKTKELSRRGSSTSPVERNVHSSSSGDGVLKVDSVSTDDSFPWSQHTSSSGKTYYYNCKTEKSQWEKPKEWLEREFQMEREKKKHETKERSDQSRDNSQPNCQSTSSKDRSSARDSSRELSNKRDSQGHAVIGNKYDNSRERTFYTRNEDKRLPQQRNQESKRLSQQQDNKRLPQQHISDNKRSQQHHSNVQATSHIIKTTSSTTTAVSTAIHRVDQAFAKAETKVSPSRSLQDVSPPVTPVITVQSSSPAVAASPIISTRSPVMLTHPSPATVHTKSPVQQNLQRLLPVPHKTSSTPPPPPPPIFPQVSPTQNVAATQARYTDSSPKNSLRGINVESREESATFNGLNNFSQSQLHPLQQATLLQQAQFQGNVVLRPIGSGVISRSPGPAHFQPIKQSNSKPSSPQPFHPRPYQSIAPAVQRTSVACIKQPILHPAAQCVNLQDFASQFSRELITHTLGWPADSMEKQAQRSADDTTNLCVVNSRLKADLIPLNFHQNLTRMRMGVGTKRIEFLRAQTRQLESSDGVS